MFSLSKLSHNFFLTVDVCGMIKIWNSAPTPSECMSINLDSGVAYNSTIELLNFNTPFDLTAIAVALKSNIVHVILIDPFMK